MNNNQQRDDDGQYSNQAYNQNEPYDHTLQNHLPLTPAIDLSDVMPRTFLYMFLALIISGIAAYLTYTSNLAYTLLVTDNAFYALVIVEIGVVIAATTCLNKKIVSLSAVLFIVYSIINGVTLSVFAYLYELSSIASILGITAIVFGAMAAYGLLTKSDLTSLGSIGIMVVIGGLLATLGNIFIFKSNSLSIIVTVVTLAAFIGLTAYDTQKIKRLAVEQPELGVNIIALFGALNLYIDFINIFLKLLRLFGKRR